MKKFLALLLVMILVCVPAFASTVDLGSLTDSELEELQSDLNNEFISRGLVIDQPFPAGNYIAGKNIRAGSYTIKADKDTTGRYYIYSTEDGFKDHDYASIKMQGLFGQIGTETIEVYIEDGMVFQLEISKGSATISTQKAAWMP